MGLICMASFHLSTVLLLFKSHLHADRHSGLCSEKKMRTAVGWWCSGALQP